MTTATVEPLGGQEQGAWQRLLEWRRAWLSMDKNPRALAFAASPAGIVAVHAAFLAGLAASMQFSTEAIVLVAATLAGCAAFPQRRLLILTASSLFFFVVRPFRTQAFTDMTHTLAGSVPGGVHPMILQTGMGLGFLALVWLWLEYQRKNPTGFAGRRPLLVHLWAFGLLVAAGCLLSPGTWSHATFWVLMAIWGSSFWMLAYMMTDLKGGNSTPNVARAGFMRPVWGGSATPIGKGHSYLGKFEAKNEEDLAVTRLKAVKLIVWAAILNALYVALDGLIHGQAGVPTLHQSVMAQIGGHDLALGMRWAGLITTYFLDLIIIAFWGHVLVSIVRMIGYRIPRNTVNPLASRSLAEFWNRYFFYYKELLVDFFFYPAFLRWFKKTPKLRIAFATLCAAGFGNFLYHAMSEIHVFALMDVADALPRFTTFAFYVLVLSTGLIVSQIRGRRPKPEDGFWRYQVLPRLNVMLFFCFLKIFDDIFGHGSLTDRFTFLAGLFGVTT
jgi:hypothetical protein